VGDLVVFLHEIQLRDHPRVVLELSLTNSKQVLDAVLNSLIDLSFVENTLESFKDGGDTLRR
jgi:hypothetical protein